MVRRLLNRPLVILQGLVRMLRLSTGRRFKVFVLSGLFGLSFLTTSLGALPIVASHVQAQSLVVSQGNPRQDLQQGILLYKAERYAEAIALWNAALATFAQQNDSIGQALSLNNLSLGYQQLGQWPEAETAVSQSLEILSEAQTEAQTLLPSADVHETLGKVLNTQGELLWAQGKPEAALAIWEDAVGYYQMAAHSVGVAIAQINQAKALQSLGLNAQATTLLSGVYQTLRQTADDALQAAGLKALGQALRRIGELAQAQEVLLEGSHLAQEPAAKGEILLELGNTEQDLRRQALARGQSNAAEILAQNGLDHYQLAAQLASSPLLSLQAQVNALRLLILTGQWDAVASTWPSMIPALLELSPSRSAVYAQLNFADSLTCLRQPSQLAVLTCMGNVSSQQPIVTDAPLELAPPPSETIARILTTAIGYSRQIQDTLSESFALGQLGQLYAVNRQPTEAIALTKQGIELAESLQVSESAFRLYRQLGQLLNQTDNRQAAIAAYKEAVDALDQIRGSLLRINSEVLFSFRDNTEPIYREFVDLLLTGNPSDTSLREAVRNIDNLQRTELENFLGCDLSQLFEIGTGTIDPTAAKIYPIILPERLAIILEIPGQSLRYYQTPVSQGQFEKALRNLRTQLTEPGLTPEVIVEATKIYQWLIDPLEPALENNPQIQTLVFVPDGALRNIPMGVLYD
ncbi:MAG: tetratricopeptide repeat protein, partial [Nodosilinea sp.]